MSVNDTSEPSVAGPPSQTSDRVLYLNMNKCARSTSSSTSRNLASFEIGIVVYSFK